MIISIKVQHNDTFTILNRNSVTYSFRLAVQVVKSTINKTVWNSPCYFSRGFLCFMCMTNTRSLKPQIHFSVVGASQQLPPENQNKAIIYLKYLIFLQWCTRCFTLLINILLHIAHEVSWSQEEKEGAERHVSLLNVLLVLTRRADAISIKYVVTPDGLSCGSIQHGPHHLIKGLIGITPQCALWVFVNEASAKSCRETSKLASPSCCILNRWLANTPMSQVTRLLVSRLTSVERGFVQNQSIFDVVATVAHHSHGGVLSSRQFLKFNNLNGFCFHHWPLRIRQQVHKSVDAISLVVANSAWREKRRQRKVLFNWLRCNLQIKGKTRTKLQDAKRRVFGSALLSANSTCRCLDVEKIQPN